MLSPRRLVAGLTALAGLFVGLGRAPARLFPLPRREESKGDKVRFTTVDGVEIQGLFYQGKKRNAPTVMMLHALGEDSRKKAWASLAGNP